MSLFGYDLAHPWALLAALFALPAIWWAQRSAGRVVFSSLRALPHGGRTWRTAIAWLPDALIALAVVAFAVALAGPRRGDDTARIRRDGIAIVMAVDISSSMRALDLSAKNQETSRLDAVKSVFEQFVLGGGGLDGRPDDTIGLVAFAHYADTRSPLTLDHGNLVVAARQLDYARDDEDGTAIGAGLELAVQRVADSKAKSKVIVLLTDGESNIHDIDEDDAIRDAMKAGVKVYTIGAGTNGIAPIRIPTEDGGTELRQMRVSIDETLLRKIADRTGGRYFRATDHASLEHIYEEIDKLERTTHDEEHFVSYRQYFDVALVIAIGALAIAWLLGATLLRRLP